MGGTSLPSDGVAGDTETPLPQNPHRICDVGVGESARVIASVTRKRSRGAPPLRLSRRSRGAAGAGAGTPA